MKLPKGARNLKKNFPAMYFPEPRIPSNHYFETWREVWITFYD